MRVPPRPVHDWPHGLLDRCEQIVTGQLRPEANVYCTLANSPALFEAWLALGAQVLRRSELTPRQRELVILRTTAMTAGTYPFTQHVRIGKEAGITDDEIGALHRAPTLSDWSEADRLLLSAVDELLLTGMLSDESWSALTAAPGEARRVIGVTATVAFYRMAAWMLNVAGTELDPGQQAALGPVSAHEISPPASSGPTRLAPEPVDQWQRALLAETASWPRFQDHPERRSAGVYGTLAHNPELFRAIGPLMAYIMVDNELSDRHREMVIVRSCLRDRAQYPYRQHVAIARTVGLSAEELQQISEPHSMLDDQLGSAVIQAVDQLHDENTIDDELFDALVAQHSVPWVFDLVATAGFYGLVSFTLNSARTPLEPGETLLPNLILEKTAR